MCLLILLLASMLSRSNISRNLPMSEDEKTAADYVQSRGYTIEEHQGTVSTYILEKSRLNSSGASASGNLPYIKTWSLQENEPDNYFGKEVSSYTFIVSGHPLDKQYNTHTRVSIMMVDGKVVGGTSSPDVDADGGPYDLDGRTLEEVTGISLVQWREQWDQKYNN